MSRRNKTTPKTIADEFKIEVDNVLLECWEMGLEKVISPNDFIPKRKVPALKRRLGLATKKDLISIDYWSGKLKLTKVEFIEYCLEIGIEINPNSKTIPKGGVKKLRKNIEVELSAKSSRSRHIDEKKNEKFLNDFELQSIGKQSDIIYLDTNQVLLIHESLVNDFKSSSDPIEPSGVKNPHLLESAITRPKTSFGDVQKYGSIELASAALLHSLVHNHPFHNGNKRTALVSLLVSLDNNGLVLYCNQDELYKFVLKVARHGLVPNYASNIEDREVCEIAKWTKSSSRAIERGDRIISRRRLLKILRSYECVITEKAAGKLKIERKVRDLKGSNWFKKKFNSLKIIINPGSGDVQISTIKKIRKELRLSEEDGIDSMAFYSRDQESIDTFINRYRRTLKRLAKL